jgi:tellurite resistance protein
VERTTLPFARILNLSIARGKGGESDVVDRSPLSNAEIESVLEIALTMATANGDTSPEELDSLADLVAHLRGKRPKPGELGTIMTTIQARDVSASVEERVKIIAKTLHRSVARELAYKAAYAIRVADLESNPDEEELGEILVEALGLEDLAADLENEVNEALIAE